MTDIHKALDRMRTASLRDARTAAETFACEVVAELEALGERIRLVADVAGDGLEDAARRVARLETLAGMVSGAEDRAGLDRAGEGAD